MTTVVTAAPIRLLISSLGGLAALVVAVALLVVVLIAALVGGRSGTSGPLGAVDALPYGLTSQPSEVALSEIPPDQLAVMRQAAATAPCPLNWSVLAGVARVESVFGTNMATSSAGAIGYGQFLPGTWAMPGIGNGGNPYDYRDALPAMARYLCASGAGQDLRRALFAYNHADWYVDEVLAFAAQYGTRPAPASGGSLAPGWAALPALNQYDRRYYRSDTTWLMWRDAACSAASLAWLLRAYGDGTPSIDGAIDLIGRDTGITTGQGLSDHTAPALAAAIAKAGLAARRGQMHSIAQLKTWLDQGPLLLDGQSWFIKGHWFVALGYDDAGIVTRDSSSHNTQYLSWARLYGEVGFSGWVVGVDGAVPAEHAAAAAADVHDDGAAYAVS